MDYDFGDILDAREVPSIGHFILVVGEVTKAGQTEIMYYMIFSRVYTVFKTILTYFNDCLRRGDREFLKFFGKEKTKSVIVPCGLLSQAVFLDRDTNYAACLDVESMIIVNSDPNRIDKNAIEQLRKDKNVVFKGRLAKLDALNLIHTIKCSGEVSPDRTAKISRNFNLIKTSLK